MISNKKSEGLPKVMSYCSDYLLDVEEFDGSNREDIEVYQFTVSQSKEMLEGPRLNTY